MPPEILKKGWYKIVYLKSGLAGKNLGGFNRLVKTGLNHLILTNFVHYKADKIKKWLFFEGFKLFNVEITIFSNNFSNIG